MGKIHFSLEDQEKTRVKKVPWWAKQTAKNSRLVETSEKSSHQVMRVVQNRLA